MGVTTAALPASRWGWAHPTDQRETCLPEGLLGWLRTPGLLLAGPQEAPRLEGRWMIAVCGSNQEYL